MKIIAKIVGIGVFLHGISISAAQWVIPPEAANRQGNSDTVAPFGQLFGSDYQVIIPAVNFPAVEAGTGFLISEVAFRLDEVNFQGAADTLERVRLSASTTTKTINQVSTDTRSNHGSDYSILFDASLRFEAPPPSQNPENFDFPIPLAQAFRYFPENGSLVFQIEKFGGSRLRPLLDAERFSGITIFGGMQSPKNIGPDIHLLMRITYATVPEPRTLSLIFLGALLIIGVNRKS